MGFGILALKTGLGGRACGHCTGTVGGCMHCMPCRCSGAVEMTTLIPDINWTAVN